MDLLGKTNAEKTTPGISGENLPDNAIMLGKETNHFSLSGKGWFFYKADIQV